MLGLTILYVIAIYGIAIVNYWFTFGLWPISWWSFFGCTAAMVIVMMCYDSAKEKLTK